MAQFLVKLFVKDYENVKDLKVRTAYGVLSSVVGILCNVLLFAVKFLIGKLTLSVSVVSDAFNNLSDSASALIGLVGVKLAEKPADDEHPFGHGRLEYVSALIVSFLIILVGYEFLKTSISAILHPEALQFHAAAFFVLLISLSVKLFLALFNRTLGKRIDSVVMEATAQDALGDILVTCVTLVSMLLYRFFQWKVDGYAGLFVSLMILKAGISVAKDTIQPLIGESVDPEAKKLIKGFVEGYEGIAGTHDLIVHSYGPGRKMATLHAEVPQTMGMLESHELMDRIEKDARDRLGLMLVLHADPVSVGPEAEQMKKDLAAVLEKEGPGFSYHDFRLVMGEKRINLIFDVVSPVRFAEAEEEALKERIQKAMREKDARYICVINVDYRF